MMHCLCDAIILGIMVLTSGLIGNAINFLYFIGVLCFLLLIFFYWI